jgi:hypothetical protein
MAARIISVYHCIPDIFTDVCQAKNDEKNERAKFEVKWFRWLELLDASERIGNRCALNAY